MEAQTIVDSKMNESALESYASQTIQEKRDNRSLFSKLINWYFEPKSFERSGKLYERLGVRQFKKFLFNGDYMNALMRKVCPNYRSIIGYEEDSARIARLYTKINEGAHIIGNGIMVPLIISSIMDNNYSKAVISVGINTLVNVYPIMTQRYNRARICNVLDKMEARKQRKLNDSMPKAGAA